MKSYEDLRALARDCEYSDGAGFPDEGAPDSGVDGLIEYKNALEEIALSEGAALLAIHRSLYPERYGYNADHRYWDDFDPETDSEDEYRHDHGVYEWDSGTIEDVAGAIERALTGHPDYKEAI